MRISIRDLPEESFYIKFHRGTEAKLSEMIKIPYDNEIICTIPDYADEESRKDIGFLKSPIFRYKIGDGIHKWSELEYQEGTIPIAVANTNMMMERDKAIIIEQARKHKHKEGDKNDSE